MTAQGDRDQTRRVTSIDVASEAGVSQATVARVFSSPELVAEATRAKVEEAAERIGYVPNAIARSLKSQRTNIIGAVVPAYGEYWQSVLTSLSRHLVGEGQQLLLFSFENPDDVQQALGAVAQYRLDGLILASSTIRHGQLAEMKATGLPLVAFNQPAANSLVASVNVDNESGTRELARHLVATGVRRVLFIGGVASASTDQVRYRGAAQELGSRGVPCGYLEAGAYTYEAGYKAAQAVIETPAAERPDAIMVGADEVAFGVIDGLRSADIDVPGDISVTGFDGLPQASWAGYDLTTVVQPTEVLAQRTVDQLLGDTKNDVVDIVVPGTIRLGKTTKAPTPTETEKTNG